MSVTQDQSPCFNKLLPICSTPKKSQSTIKWKLNSNAITYWNFTFWKCSECKHHYSSPLALHVVNIEKFSDKSNNIHYQNQKNGRPKKKVLNWHCLHQKLLVYKIYQDLSILCNELVYILYQIYQTHSLVNLLLEMTGLTIHCFIMCPGTFHKSLFFTIQ